MSQMRRGSGPSGAVLPRASVRVTVIAPGAEFHSPPPSAAAEFPVTVPRVQRAGSVLNSDQSTCRVISQ